jgi:hypothetical protein
VEEAIVVLGTLLALASWGATVGWHRAALLERVVEVRRRTVRALADLAAGR